MIAAPILQPVVALMVWTMLMWLWMYATRIPAMKRAGIDVAGLRGGSGADLKAVLPPQVQWKADNYNHLHEAPTLFYAAALVLAIAGPGDPITLWIAWMYVALRVIHSVVQATVNVVAVRFALFALSTLALGALIVNAAMAVFGWS